jgi:two-component system LytT family response regulator
MQGIKVLIIEDEAPAARRLQKMLEATEKDIEVIAHLDSVESSVKWLDAHDNEADLIFMDIQLSDGISFEIFNKTTVSAPVIFTTAYDEYSLKAFKVNSIDYLLKPITPDDLSQALDKYEKLTKGGLRHEPIDKIDALLRSLNLKNAYKSRFLVKIGDKYYSIPTENIAYFYTEEKAVYLYTYDKIRYPLDQSLDEIEKSLDPGQFFRLNRQFIAHVSAVYKLHAYFNGKLKVNLKPEADHEIIVSRDKASILKEWLDR